MNEGDVTVSSPFAAFSGQTPQRSLQQIADHMRSTNNDKHRLKWGFELLRGVADPEADLPRLIADEPAPIGDPRFDAFVAAAAEYVALTNAISAPQWCFQERRVLPFGWHLAEYQQARRWAYGRTPGPFLGRGIYIEERDLLDAEPNNSGALHLQQPDRPTMGNLNRDNLRDLFDDLSTELRAKNVIGYVHLAGGAAMALAYGSELTTGDAATPFEPDGPKIEAIRSVATKHGLPASWLNNQASVYFSRRAVPTETVYDSPSLRVMVTPADHLLAMKILAARTTRDRDDALLLIEHLKFTARQQLTTAFATYFPDEVLTTRQIAFLDALGLP